MGLIVFEILFVLIFIVLSLSFIIRKDRHGFALSFISITGTLVTGLLSILYVLLYFDISGIHTMIITKVIYVGVAAVTGMLLYLALKAPYFDKKSCRRLSLLPSVLSMRRLLVTSGSWAGTHFLVFILIRLRVHSGCHFRAFTLFLF